MVTGNAWRKNNRRELRHSLGRFLAIMAIVALGVGFFAGLKITRPAMVKTGNAYVQDTAMFDYRLISTLGLTQEDVDYFAGLDGVEAAEGAESLDFTAELGDRGLTLKALSLSDTINRPSLIAGRMPENGGECLADADHFTEADLGGVLTVTQTSLDGILSGTEFTIVGLCETPLYLGIDRGTTTLGGGSLNGFVILPIDAFDADYFTELYLRVRGGDAEIYTEAYDQAIDTLRQPVTDALENRAQLRYQSIIGDARAKLDEARQSYEDGKQAYQEERAQVEQELAGALQALEDGEAQISANEAQLWTAQQELEAGKTRLEQGQAEYNEGLAAFEAAKADAYAQLDAAQAELDANQATVDAGMQQLEDSGILIQYEALLVTQRQLEQQLAQAEPGSAEALLYQGLLDTTQLLIEQFQKSEAYTGYQQLLQAQAQLDAAQAELDAKRAEAKAQLDQTQAELDAALQQLEDSKAQLASGEQQLSSGRAALVEARAALAQARSDYEDGLQQAQEGFAEAEAQLAGGARELEKAEVEVEKIEHPKSYVLDRNTNTGYVSFENDSSIVAGIAEVFPLFFFAVAALVCMTTMSRMIDEQRTQIGTLKALGYSDGMIAWKYMSYSGGAALLGCLVGFFGGTWLFPLFIWKGYSILYDFTPILYQFDWSLGLISLVASLACSAGAVWLSCRAELKQMPAQLMRPKAPKPGKRIFLERVPLIWNRFSFLYKVSIRNIVRYKKRLFMMLLGIGGCTALIVTGLGLRDTISTVVDDQFEGITHYQITVTFSTPMDEDRQQIFREEFAEDMTDCVFVQAAAYEVRTQKGISNVNIIATDDPGITTAVGFHDGTRTVVWPQSGAIISKQLANLCGIGAGDSLAVSISDTETVSIPVQDLFDNYVYHYAYMSTGTYERLFGTACEFTTAYIITDGDAYALGAKLAEHSRVASVTISDAMREIVNNTMKSLDYIVGLVVACACALALVVLFNLCNISITERVREIATVKVLGFYHRETLHYVFREILLLSGVGAAVGLPFGWALHRFVMNRVRVDMVSFRIHVAPLSYVLAFLITLLLSLLVCLCLTRKIDRIHMAESLKSIE